MGLLALKRFMSMQREDRRRRQIKARNGLITSVANTPCLLDDNSQGRKRLRYSGPNLPEDIWCHIHSLLPLRDAARVACVSHAFLRSWRCHPNLTFSKETLSLEESECKEGEMLRDLARKIDHILKNHSGIGVKTLKLEFYDCGSVDTCCLNNWLQIAVRPGIEEFTLLLPSKYGAKYNFPCSLLFDGSGNSIRDLRLSWCAFRPTVGLGCLRSLTSLNLSNVCITGDELGCLLSNSFALEELELMSCREIICLKIPCVLQRLSYMLVSGCRKLKVIESKAPNLSTFQYTGDLVQLSLGESLQDLDITGSDWFNIVYYARSELPSIVPNLECLDICSTIERDTPIVPGKFLHLKYLCISLAGAMAFCPGYDYYSLVSFLDAAPSLETFILSVSQTRMKHDLIFGDSSNLRLMPGHRHNNIKNVKIIGFCSAKSMVELTCHILENTPSLEYLVLDTYRDNVRCSTSKSGKCLSMSRHMIMEAHKALLTVRRYIVRKVPSAVKFDVLGPCSRCHAIDL